MIDEAAYIKLSNRVVELEKALEKLKGNLTTLSSGGLTPIGAPQVAGVGGLATFDFLSIPANYSKIIIDVYARGDTAAGDISFYLKFNNDAGAVYNYNALYSMNSAVWNAVSGYGANYIVAGFCAAGNAPAGIFDSLELSVLNYAQANGNKSVSGKGTLQNNTLVTALYDYQCSGWWRPAAPAVINRITLTPSAGNFAQYSVAKLYGVI